MASSVDFEELKSRNLKLAKADTKAAINSLNSVLKQLEANDGSYIDLNGAHGTVTDLAMDVAALNTLNGHDV